VKGVNKQLAKANSLLSKKKYKKALKILFSLLDIEELKTQCLVKISYIHNRQKEFERAILTSKEVLKEDPYSSEAYDNLCYAYDQTYQFEEMYDTFKSYLEHLHQDIDILSFTSNYQNKVENFNEPKLFLDLNGEINILVSMNKKIEKKSLKAEWIKLNGPKDFLLFNIASTFELSNIKSLENRERFIELIHYVFPELVKPIKELSILSDKERGAISKALKYCGKALKMDENYKELYFLYGKLLLKQNRLKEAQDILTKGLSVSYYKNPQIQEVFDALSQVNYEIDYTDYMNKYIYYLLAKIYFIKSEFSNAYAAIVKALEREKEKKFLKLYEKIKSRINAFNNEGQPNDSIL